MQVEEKNRQLNEDAETIEEKNELKTGKKKHRKNNFAAGMAVGAAAAIMGCSLAGIYFKILLFLLQFFQHPKII